MEHRHQACKPGLVLKLDKRRYDGGTEIDLIQYLEAKRHPVSVNYKSVSIPEKTEHKHVQKISRPKALINAVIQGPLELAVGGVGILTSLMALYVFNQAKQQNMVEQSKLVLVESVKAMIAGGINTLFLPIKVLKVALVGV